MPLFTGVALVESLRPCGSCRECCIVLEVSELKKPRLKPCDLLCEAGCSIHGKEEREEICKTYQCGWSKGFFKDEYRPDKSGVIVHTTKNTDTGEIWVMFYECKEGSVMSGKGREMLELVAQNPVSIRIEHYDGSHSESPADV